MKKPKKQSNIVPLSGTAHLTQKMHDRIARIVTEEYNETFDIRGFLVGLGVAQQLAGENKELQRLFEAVQARASEGELTKNMLQDIIDGLGGK